MNQNAFTPMQESIRVLIVFYVVVYRIIHPILGGILSDDPGNVSFYVITEIIYSILLFLPILFYKKTYGWFHPLIFPPLYELVRSLAQNPYQLLNIFFMPDIGESHIHSHIALQHLSTEQLINSYIVGNCLKIISLLAFYTAYYFYSVRKTIVLKQKTPSFVSWKAAIIVFLSSLVFVFLIKNSGGIINHLIILAQGRFQALAGEGQTIVFIKLGIVASIIWFALDQNAQKKIIFWVLLIASILISFLANGSRSNILYPVFILLMLWMVRGKNIQIFKVLSIVIVAVFVIGLLGQVRSVFYGGQLYSERIAENEISDILMQGAEEMRYRSTNNGFLPIVANVPDNINFLYGNTYLPALFFFVPRKVWEEKPRGAGAMVGHVFFGDGEINDPVEDVIGYSVPPSAVGEAFWNFGVPGVIIIYILYGMFLKWLTVFFTINQDNPAAIVLYILTIFNLTPTSVSVISYLQLIIPTIAILLWMNAINIDCKNYYKYNSMERI